MFNSVQFKVFKIKAIIMWKVLFVSMFSSISNSDFKISCWNENFAFEGSYDCLMKWWNVIRSWGSSEMKTSFTKWTLSTWIGTRKRSPLLKYCEAGGHIGQLKTKMQWIYDRLDKSTICKLPVEIVKSMRQSDKSKNKN